MTPLPHFSGRTVVRALERGGFAVTHVRGRHRYLRLPGATELVVVPVHGNRDLPTGTLRAILRQANIIVDELICLLNE